MTDLTMAEFDRVDIRAGTIVDVQPFPEARKPALKLWIDFGPTLGVRRSSAQVTVHYEPASLIGPQPIQVIGSPIARRSSARLSSEALAAT